MKKPTFLIIGCQKSGTTSLRYYLNQHPDIGMIMYEGHFFTNNSNPNIQKYFEWFSNFKEKEIGEKTPDYIFHSYVPKLIHKYLPNIKIIIMFRNPADRAYSEYWMQKLNGIEKNNFSYAIRYFPRSYLQRGLYAKQLKNVLNYFSINQIFWIKAEDFKINKIKILKELFKFLNVDDSFIPKDLTDRHIGGKPNSIILTKITSILEKIRNMILSNMRDNGAKFIYILFSFFIFHIKRKNKQIGYPKMKIEDRKFIYNELKNDMNEFYNMTGIKWQ